jgi:two-component system OmpR family sensor kinase
MESFAHQAPIASWSGAPWRTVQQNDVAVEVADHGSARRLQELALRKVRLHRSAQGDARRGISVGLYLVKVVADLHHGEAPVMDREGGGAVFTLLLP